MKKWQRPSVALALALADQVGDLSPEDVASITMMHVVRDLLGAVGLTLPPYTAKDTLADGLVSAVRAKLGDQMRGPLSFGETIDLIRAVGINIPETTSERTLLPAIYRAALERVASLACQSYDTTRASGSAGAAATELTDRLATDQTSKYMAMSVEDENAVVEALVCHMDLIRGE